MSTASTIDPATLSLPEDASLFTRLRLSLRLLKLIKGDEGNPVYGQLLNACLDGNVYASLARELRRSEAWRSMLSAHPSLQAADLDLDALARLPEGTLGQAYARYYRDNKISPFATTLEIRSDVDFIAKRYRETHDLLHVLTGYGTDVMGEMELQAYALGNLGIRTALLILVVGTLGQLKGRQAGVGSSEYLRRVRAAYRRGRASPQFLDFWFEHHWETPVTTLRARLCAPANGSDREAAHTRD
ncbi:Coq4 family protein [Nannocystis sp. SCPEA4]|uniref:Coq4 family protein n=1 Tax=Nannocystis sp. SCPEA4 TaxID=2996787 RepID=UPI002271C6A3|nr:Coq4 family protein [Nannocystis sp. SCPEA4]MCY1058083.1 Coq4 family protein [Nannocystis sp. SCPEA4]